MTTLVIVLKNKDKSKYDYFYSSSKAEIITNGSDIFLNRDSFHIRLNSHYKTWSYKKKKLKKIKAYMKSLWKEPTVNRCMLILDSKLFGPQFVDNLFIIRLRLNLTMCRALIINYYFLVQKRERWN